MKTLFATLCATVSVGLSAIGAAWATDGWVEDFEQGISIAAAEGRTALVEFTGTDWCHFCILLKKNVFPTQEFADFVKEKNLVLIELDFPHAANKITPEQRAKNEQVGAHYNVQGYPTVLVMDGYKQPYGQVSGGSKNAKEYIARLQKVLDVKAAYEQKVEDAKKLSGQERIAALQEALALVPANCRSYHTKLEADIIDADPEDTTGLRKKRDAANLLQKQLDETKEVIRKSMNGRSMQDELPTVQTAILDLLKRDDLLPFVRLTLNAFLSQTYISEGKYDEALKYMDAAIESAPDTKEAEVMRKGRIELEEMAKRSRQP